MENEKMEMIDNKEFQTLYDKSKKLIDSARNNMGQMANAITVLTSNVAGMRQFYVAYKDRGDEIIQLGIGQFEQAFEIIQSEIDGRAKGFRRVGYDIIYLVDNLTICKDILR